MSQQQENGLANTAGLEIFGSNFIKKNINLISRMKRSLSASGKPTPLKLTRDVPSSTSEWHSPLSEGSLKSPFNRTTFISPEATKTSFLTTEIGPTRHLSYETFASSSSNLSIRSFPATRRRSSTNDNLFYNTTTSKNNSKVTVNSGEKQQAKMMFENRLPLETEKPKVVKNDGVVRAPAPAMYWSRPTLFGIVPPKLRAHVGVVFEDKMFVFGGAEKSQCSDTLYVFDLDTFTWSKPRVYGTSPPACRAHSFTADQKNGVLYLFGGGDGQQYYNHLYMFDVDTMCWHQLETENRPPERRAHVSMIWHHHLYIFGGGDGTKALNDVYKLDLDKINNGDNEKVEWEKVNVNQDDDFIIPDSRGYHTGTLVGDKWVIYGGSDGKECFGSCHVLDLNDERWTDVTQDVNIPRLSHSALCVGSFLFVLGGHDGTKYCNDLMMLNLENMNWEARRVYGHTPTPRGYHSAVLYDSRIFVFGGYNGQSFFNDVYVLELSSFAYLPQIVNFSINAHNK